MTGTIVAVLAGRPVPFGNTMSAIAKQAVDGPVAIGTLGVAGDQVGDPTRHGGEDKAVHQYGWDHYAAWRDELPDGVAATLLARPGAFGENLCVAGMTEENVCLGDLWQAGSVTLRSTQVRQPCWKLNRHFAVPDMARRVQVSGRTGWHWQVVQPGILAAGDSMTLAERPLLEWSLHRLVQVLYVDTLDRDALAELAAQPLLAPVLRELAAARLARGTVEDWNGRLRGRPVATPPA
jgi:MOSC domain-containing protein YiiM